jgi:hypothetical protein
LRPVCACSSTIATVRWSSEVICFRAVSSRNPLRRRKTMTAPIPRVDTEELGRRRGTLRGSFVHAHVLLAVRDEWLAVPRNRLVAAG